MNSIIIKTNIPCTAMRIKSLRKEVIQQALNILGKEGDQHRLFHNHTEEGNIKRYPQVQYRSHQRKLVVFGCGEGVDVLKKMIIASDPEDHLLHINNVEMTQHKNNFTPSDINQYYRLKDWIPMNSDNYNTWKKSYSMTERLKILNNAINGHLKILASNFLAHDESQAVHGELFMIERIKSQEAFNTKVLGANVIFKTTYHLPSNFALGRNVSIGAGTFQQLRNNPEK